MHAPLGAADQPDDRAVFEDIVARLRLDTLTFDQDLPASVAENDATGPEAAERTEPTTADAHAAPTATDPVAGDDSPETSTASAPPVPAPSVQVPVTPVPAPPDPVPAPTAALPPAVVPAQQAPTMTPQTGPGVSAASSPASPTAVHLVDRPAPVAAQPLRQQAPKKVGDGERMPVPPRKPDDRAFRWDIALDVGYWMSVAVGVAGQILSIGSQIAPKLPEKFFWLGYVAAAMGAAFAEVTMIGTGHRSLRRRYDGGSWGVLLLISCVVCLYATGLQILHWGPMDIGLAVLFAGGTTIGFTAHTAAEHLAARDYERDLAAYKAAVARVEERKAAAERRHEQEVLARRREQEAREQQQREREAVASTAVEAVDEVAVPATSSKLVLPTGQPSSASSKSTPPKPVPPKSAAPKPAQPKPAPSRAAVPKAAPPKPVVPPPAEPTAPAEAETKVTRDEVLAWALRQEQLPSSSEVLKHFEETGRPLPSDRAIRGWLAEHRPAASGK